MATSRVVRVLHCGCLLLVVAGLGPAGGCSGGGGSDAASVITVDSNDLPLPPPNPNAGASGEVVIAKCLTASGAVLYGANWCGYTKQQIASFRDGARYLTYVECTQQAQLCKDRGVTGYPTWIIRGELLTGYHSPTELGAMAGCTW